MNEKININFTKSILCHFIYKTLEVKNAALLLYILVGCNSFFRIAAIAIHLFNCNVRRGHFRGRCISHTQSRIIVKRWPHPRSTNTSTVRRFSHGSWPHRHIRRPSSAAFRTGVRICSDIKWSGGIQSVASRSLFVNFDITFMLLKLKEFRIINLS